MKMKIVGELGCLLMNNYLQIYFENFARLTKIKKVKFNFTHNKFSLAY